MKSKAVCPNCSSASLHRSSRRNGPDFFMRMLGKAPVRCYSCYKRYYMSAALSKKFERADATRTARSEGSGQGSAFS